MTLRESLHALLAESDPWEGLPQDLWDKVKVGAGPLGLGKLLAKQIKELSAERIYFSSRPVGPKRIRTWRLSSVLTENDLIIQARADSEEQMQDAEEQMQDAEEQMQDHLDQIISEKEQFDTQFHVNLFSHDQMYDQMQAEKQGYDQLQGCSYDQMQDPHKNPRTQSKLDSPEGRLKWLTWLQSFGLNIIPLKRGEKRPKSSWEEYQTRQATQAELADWSRAPLNVAILTGAISRIVVVDLDTPEALAWAQDHLPATPIKSRTGTKDGYRGQHWFYRHPCDGQTIPNKVKAGSIALDLRADGGYVVAPFSLHPSGVNYEQIGEWNTARFEQMPTFRSTWLPVSPTVTPRVSAQSHSAASAIPSHIPANDLRKRIFAYVEGVPQAPEGGRNNAATVLTRKIWDKIGDHPVGYEALEKWNLSNSKPLDEKELLQTYRSALKKTQNTGGEWLREEPPMMPRPTPQRPTSKPEPISEVAPQAPEPENSKRDSFIDEYTFSDIGNGQRLARAHGKDLRYVTSQAEWRVWDGARWDKDHTGQVVKFAKTLFLSLYENESQESRQKWYMKCLNRDKVSNCIEMAKTERGIPLRKEVLDEHPFLFNCLNGTVHLKTGELKPHRREDNLTKLSGVSFEAAKTCPTWERFLLMAFEGDQEMVDYLQTAVGYSLTGDCREEIFFFLFGGGGNGKSTFLRVLGNLLGDYARNASLESFSEDGARTANRSDIARLDGARLVTSSEAREGAGFDTALIKTLTGRDPITACHKYKDEFEFMPQFKLWLSANTKPTIKDNSEGTWRRLHLVPFTVKPSAVDTSLAAKLSRELPGILNWAIKGCLKWQREGFRVPAKVAEAVRQYRNENDQLGRFIEECCVVGHQNAYCTAASDLRAAYEAWCAENSEKAWSATTVGKSLASRGYTSGRAPFRTWFGIGLKSAIADPGNKLQGQLPGLEGIAPDDIPL